MTTNLCQKLIYLLFMVFIYVLEGHNEVSLELSLLQAEQAQLPQPVFIGEVLQLSDIFVAFPWICSSSSLSSLCWKPQTWTQYSRWGHRRTE